MVRMEKVNQQIKREIGNMIQYGEINDPRLTFVTITYVECSKDLQHARVGFSVLSNDRKEIQNVQEGLSSARGFVRKLIGQRVRLRYTPEIVFIHDNSLSYASKIDQTLEEIKKMPKEGGKADE
ncbi:MAG: 30S ribosome-binding factor RbfA [Candidatus Omnitrophica bacterium]|nr:30S ribosome-binding factor RbfA [Candidatus Omnitrophota bacterium]